MLVGLDAEQEKVCRGALMPVEVVSTPDVKAACTSMSTVLPLVVIVQESLTDADRTTLSEMTTACGAEIVTMESDPTTKTFASRLLEALRIAERRRLGMR